MKIVFAEPINTYSAYAVDRKTGYGALYGYYPLVTGYFNEQGVLVKGSRHWAEFNPSLWLGYAPLNCLELSFALPFYSDFDTSSGFGDPLVQAKYQFMEEPIAAAVQVWLSLPLGSENFTTGTYDVTLGGLITKQLNSFTVFGNLYWTMSLPDEGNSISYNLAAEYDFTDIVGLFVELNGYRYNGENQLGLLPGIALFFGERFSLDLGIFVPFMGTNCDAGWTPCGFVCHSF